MFIIEICIYISYSNSGATHRLVNYDPGLGVVHSGDEDYIHLHISLQSSELTSTSGGVENIMTKRALQEGGASSLTEPLQW